MPRDKYSLIKTDEVVKLYSRTTLIHALHLVNGKYKKDSTNNKIKELMAKVLRNHMRGVYTEQGVILNYEEELKRRISFQGM